MPSIPFAQTPVSLGIIAVCVAFYFCDRWFAQVVTIDGHRGWLQIGALYGPLVRAGQYDRILLTVFEHGGMLHLVMNMSVVWTLGRSLERHIGSGRFGVVSLVTALGASTMTLLIAPDVPTIGASGMILGWAGAMVPLVTPQARRGLGIWLIQIAVISALPHVSWEGHLGGFLAGLPCGLALRAGPQRFRLAAPALVAAASALAYAVGSGHLGLHGVTL